MCCRVVGRGTRGDDDDEAVDEGGGEWDECDAL